jgi:hypothetical protein
MRSKLLLVVCLLAFTLCSVNTSRADTALDSVADIALVRPGCLVATAVGSVIFVLALPFTAPSKSVKKSADTLVVHPAQATFKRPLGDFSSLP